MRMLSSYRRDIAVVDRSYVESLLLHNFMGLFLDMISTRTKLNLALLPSEPPDLHVSNRIRVRHKVYLVTQSLLGPVSCILLSLADTNRHIVLHFLVETYLPTLSLTLHGGLETNLC